MTSTKRPLSAADRKEAVRQLKREMHQKLRDDWDMSLDPSKELVVMDDGSSGSSSNSSAGEDGARGGSSRGRKRSKRDDDPGWRDRELSPSCIASMWRTGDTSSPKDGRESDAPDAPEPAQECRAPQTRLKRREMIEAEMEWNAGLRNWMAQRDAWSGGRVRYVRRRRRRRRDSPRPALQATEPLQVIVVDGNNNMMQASAVAAAETRPTSLQKVDVREEVPAGLCIFPDSNPLRAQIVEKHYPAIYTKCVANGMTPAVPINLLDMTRAIVAGWKADGQWPARAASDPVGSTAHVADVSLAVGKAVSDLHGFPSPDMQQSGTPGQQDQGGKVACSRGEPAATSVQESLGSKPSRWRLSGASQRNTRSASAADTAKVNQAQSSDASPSIRAVTTLRATNGRGQPRPQTQARAQGQTQAQEQEQAQANGSSQPTITLSIRKKPPVLERSVVAVRKAFCMKGRRGGYDAMRDAKTAQNDVVTSKDVSSDSGVGDEEDEVDEVDEVKGEEKEDERVRKNKTESKIGELNGDGHDYGHGVHGHDHGDHNDDGRTASVAPARNVWLKSSAR